MDPELGRVRVRRPLSPDDFGRLLASANDGPVVEGISGPDRVVLYVVASYTGFRRNEIGSLTKRSFDFKSDPPMLKVKPTISKRRKEDKIPLRRDVAKMIQAWIAESKADLGVDESLLPVTGKETAEMVKADLERAGLPYVDEEGLYADFHALRGTFTTNLILGGASPKHTQDLARHSDINLTMNAYAKLKKDRDLTDAVEKLPPLPKSGRKDEPEGDGDPDGGDTPGPTGGPPSGPPPSALGDIARSIRELRREASSLGIKGYAKDTKEGLAERIRRAKLVPPLVPTTVPGGQAPSSPGNTSEPQGAAGGQEGCCRNHLPLNENDASCHHLTGGVIVSTEGGT